MINGSFDWLGTAANLIEVISFLVVISLFLHARHQYRRYVRAREVERGERPWALTVGIGGDIEGQVYEYDQGTYRLDFVLEKGSVLGLLGTGPGSTIDDLLNR